MGSARWGLAALGIVFLGLGALIASVFDALTGLVVLVVGAFLLMLPFMSSRDE